MDRKAAGLERNSRTVSGVLCRPHAGLTGCNRNVKSRDERRLTPPPLTSPRSAVIFVEKAAAACAAPALKHFCSILHRNLAFTQNLGLTPNPFDTDSICDYASQAMLKEHGQPRPCSFKFVRLYVNSWDRGKRKNVVAYIYYRSQVSLLFFLFCFCCACCF